MTFEHVSHVETGLGYGVAYVFPFLPFVPCNCGVIGSVERVFEDAELAELLDEADHLADAAGP